MEDQKNKMLELNKIRNKAVKTMPKVEQKKWKRANRCYNLMALYILKTMSSPRIVAFRPFFFGFSYYCLLLF